MARKTGARPPASPDDAVPTFERIEFQASIGWTKAIDAAAKALGLTRSAYIRQSIIRMMQAEGRTPPQYNP